MSVICRSNSIFLLFHPCFFHSSREHIIQLPGGTYRFAHQTEHNGNKLINSLFARRTYIQTLLIHNVSACLVIKHPCLLRNPREISCLFFVVVRRQTMKSIMDGDCTGENRLLHWTNTYNSSFCARLKEFLCVNVAVKLQNCQLVKSSLQVIRCI